MHFPSFASAQVGMLEIPEPLALPALPAPDWPLPLLPPLLLPPGDPSGALPALPALPLLLSSFFVLGPGSALLPQPPSSKPHAPTQTPSLINGYSLGSSMRYIRPAPQAPRSSAKLRRTLRAGTRRTRRCAAGSRSPTLADGLAKTARSTHRKSCASRPPAQSRETRRSR